MEWLIDGVEQMEHLAEELASSIQSPATWALLGDLGAGKTHFSKGFARGLGYAGDVTSPTFSLVQEYHGGRLPIFHFDWYRLKSAAEVLSIGWDDYLDQKGILLVEWANLFPELWTKPTLQVSIEILDSRRLVTLRNID